MNETKLNWADLDLFLAVARGGGLAAGATISGVSAPTLGRHMAGLERAMGEVLFKRLARGYELTIAGQELLVEAEVVEAQICGIIRRGDSRNAQLPIHISAGTWMTRFLALHIRDITPDAVRLVFHARSESTILGVGKPQLAYEIPARRRRDLRREKLHALCLPPMSLRQR